VAEYEDLPAVRPGGLKPSAPKIHGNNNVIASWKLRKGDVDQGFAEADVIVENTYRTPRQEHAHLEPESGVAWMDDSGVVTVRYAAQVIEHYRDIATVLGLPESRVRVIGTLIGGGFGGKEDVTVEVFLALLAWKTNRPVKLTYTREEMGYGRHKRHPYVLRYKTGARKDGTLTAMEADIVSDAGAYVYLSPWVLIYSTVHATGPYLIPNVKVDARSVLTNNIMTSAFRGFGGMQTVVAYEAQMDELALRLGMDPLELRTKNFLKTGDVTASYQEITSQVRLEECARKALEALGEKAAASSPRKKVGRGFACCWQSYGRMTYLHDTSNCWVNLEMDGSAVVRTGIPDLGGGQRESIRAIVAEVLGLAVEEVQVISTDSQVTPLSGTVTATRALYMSGNAAKLAAESVRGIVAETAAARRGPKPWVSG
jgi:CO/xanthine dehydrogenase Mo-binding subunit